MPHQPTALRATVTCLAAVALGAGTLAADEAQGIEFFENRIRPLLSQHCYECHSAKAEKLKANLYLDSRAGWETGGDSGPALVPGKPEESLLINAVTHENGDLQMPPKKRLAESEIEALRTWIAMGAPDPREGEVAGTREAIDLEKGREFWSFKRMADPPVPVVKDGSWPQGDIDRFILARLEEAGLEPAADAPPRTLLRRIHYDLTGLPPTREEMEAFLADPSADAYEAVVDRLLARPEFGERWGQHWLDVSRFAESSGGGRSLVFPNAWRFRDYVIDSFNADKPYDRFVREQLAGDVLEHESPEQRNEQLVGSGYLVLGPMNYELQDHELLKMEFVDEQIDTLGRTFLGMTLGCARCHDHKFDPVPTTDYYALAGIFQSTDSMGEGSAASGVTSFATTPLVLKDNGELAVLRKKKEQLDKEIASLRESLKRGDGSNPVDPAALPGIVLDSPAAKLVGEWTASTDKPRWVGDGYLHDASEGKGEKSAEFSAGLPQSGDYEVLVAYSAHTNRSTTTPVTVGHAEGETTVLIDQTKAPPLRGTMISVGTYPFDKGTPARVTISNENTKGAVIVDAVSFAPPGENETWSTPEKEPLDRKAEETRLKKLEKERKEVSGKLRKRQPVAMAPREASEPADGHVHIRGQVRNKGEKVPRGFLSVAMEPGTSARIAPDSSGRRELADWIASPDHPLTARVMTNRVWLHLLGEGIVRTPDNFGVTGDRPTHPELLDHLALRFVEDGWSVKRLIRRIVLSRTYRLTARAGTTADPENRLFGRANRKPLEAESIRDSLLLISGQLDPARGGLTIRNPGQYDLVYEFKTTRRSVYVPRFRNSVLDLFEVFDAANPNLVVGKRPRTNLPTQALFLMNSPFVREQAALTARRLLEEEASIEAAYELILCRPPTPSERSATETFLAGFPPDGREEGWTQACQALFACLDFRFLD